MKNRPLVEIHTDGACSGNPGPGGWGVLLEYGGARKEMCGGAPSTTNNRMEMTAAIMALEGLTRPCVARLHTDSTYLRDGITRWLETWEANGWRTSARKPVKNVDLWQRLQTALEGHEVRWVWVRGHSGHAGNTRADALARKGMAPFLPEERKPAAKAKTPSKAKRL